MINLREALRFAGRRDGGRDTRSRGAVSRAPANGRSGSAADPLPAPVGIPAPPIPPDEEERLDDLRRLDLLLDTPEETFDRVTGELARIFDVPCAVLGFTERDTQYHKSSVGMPGGSAAHRREPRELSVCSHVVGRNELLVVEDLLADDRFRRNPFVLESGARFYAGAPLRSEAGRAVGSLGIVDVRPRTMDGRERALLQMIAEGVMSQIRLQTASRQLLQRTRQIERDLAQAAQTQRFLLPPALVEGEGWRLRHVYRPTERLGGDFIDLHHRADGRRAILLADVSGHGTSAALTAAMAKAAFLRHAPTAAGPADLLDGVHHDLIDAVPPGRFMSALATFLDPVRRTVSIASAGHHPPLLIRGARVEPVTLENELLLLVDRDVRYRRQTTITMAPGDRLLLYTDGATEAWDPGGRQLGVDGLRRLALAALGQASGDSLDAILSGLRHYTANRFHDDVALVCLEL